MAMADYHGLDFCGICLEQLDIVDQRRRRVAEVEQNRALLLCPFGFQEERKAPLVVQDVAGIGAASRPRTLMNDTIHSAATQELIMSLIDQNPHCQFVDGRNLYGLRARDLDAPEAASGGSRCQYS